MKTFFVAFLLTFSMSAFAAPCAPDDIACKHAQIRAEVQLAQYRAIYGRWYSQCLRNAVDVYIGKFRGLLSTALYACNHGEDMTTYGVDPQLQFNSLAAAGLIQ